MQVKTLFGIFLKAVTKFKTFCKSKCLDFNFYFMSPTIEPDKTVHTDASEEPVCSNL